MKKLKQLIEIIIIPIIIVFAFYGYYNTYIQNFKNSGAEKKLILNSELSLIYNFIGQLTVYGDNYFVRDSAGGSELYGYLQYDSNSDSYNFDLVEGTEYEKVVGSLTGLGIIPDSGIYLEEINLALDYNDFFGQFYERNPEVAWIYYTSENNFINIFPWISSTEFNFSPKLQTVPYYTVATPQNNPLREALWTPIYLDEAGKGLMVTLSSPIYNEDTFMGVISIDLTASYLSNLLYCEYDGYIIDDSFSVVASDKIVKSLQEVPNLDDLISISEDNLQKIKTSQYDSITKIGSYYVYKASIKDAPWDILYIESVFNIVLKTLLNTVPIIVIGVILIFAFRESENRRKAEAMLKEAVITDQLTGLKNRRYLDSIIEKEMARSIRYNQPLSIITLDLDRFKLVNDQWGHPVGDDVLKYVSSLVKSIIRKADILVRLGGEEFMILLPQTDITGAFDAAEKIRKVLENSRHPIAGKITASFGVAEKEASKTTTKYIKGSIKRCTKQKKKDETV